MNDYIVGEFPGSKELEYKYVSICKYCIAAISQNAEILSTCFVIDKPSEEDLLEFELSCSEDFSEEFEVGVLPEEMFKEIKQLHLAEAMAG